MWLQSASSTLILQLFLHHALKQEISYRMNVLGFPGTTFGPEKNPGLLDQRLAVEWVRDNIAGFGGDPSR
jgi:hypothetical protein